ncbi:MAG: DUF2510 domain-containing protein [Demequinaceae bacterium]|nr:DUF2510 domain-containing protein [Demequinaceae bacterium]
MTAPAGWYDDPSNATHVRYWDGAQWTAHQAASQTGQGGFPPAHHHSDLGPSNPLHYIVPIGRSWQSVVAPYLGLCSLLPVPVIGQLLGIGAIVLGIIALRLARTGGHGTGRAITAIVLGAIGTLFGAFVLFNMAISG